MAISCATFSGGKPPDHHGWRWVSLPIYLGLIEVSWYRETRPSGYRTPAHGRRRAGVEHLTGCVGAPVTGGVRRPPGQCDGRPLKEGGSRAAAELCLTRGG